jgi:hypothetical protein
LLNQISWCLPQYLVPFPRTFVSKDAVHIHFFLLFFFQVSLLAGLFDISNPVQCSHFCGRHIRYGVSASKIVWLGILTSLLVLY